MTWDIWIVGKNTVSDLNDDQDYIERKFKIGNIRPSWIITFHTQDFMHAKLFSCMPVHIGNFAHKRADVYVENKNIFTFKKIYKTCVREIPIITITL